jgi:hypothetical protein
MVASSTAASTVWPKEEAKRAFMTRPTPVNPTAVENKTIEVNMEMIAPASEEPIGLVSPYGRRN